jgi:hypothetical protein
MFLIGIFSLLLNPKLKDHLLSVVHKCVFNISANLGLAVPATLNTKPIIHASIT